MPGTPLLGNLLEFRRDRMALLGRLYRDVGELALVHLGPMQIPIGTSPAFARAVLVERSDAFGKGRGLTTLARPVLGDGLLSAPADLHRRQRKLMSPEFVPRRVARFDGTIVEMTERSLRRWTSSREVDAAEEMRRLSLCITAAALFDADSEPHARAIDQALDSLCRYVTAAMSSPFPWATPGRRRVKKHVARLDAVVHGIIRARRESSGEHADLLSVLIRARDEADGTGMSDKQLRDEVMTLLIGGHETTASALSFALYLLGRHPEWYTRLQVEADQVLGTRQATAEDMPRLEYATQVFKETLRLYPPAYVIARKALEDVEICGCSIPAETLVMVNAYGIQRRPDFFPDPDRFDPARFAADAAPPRRYTYLPFGGGPRFCIGSHFGMLEGVLILSTLAQHVDLDLMDDAPATCDPALTLRPRGAIRMAARPRVDPEPGAKSE